jgi:hypothetical protein
MPAARSSEAATPFMKNSPLLGEFFGVVGRCARRFRQSKVSFP